MPKDSLDLYNATILSFIAREWGSYSVHRNTGSLSSIGFIVVSNTKGVTKGQLGHAQKLSFIQTLI